MIKIPIADFFLGEGEPLTVITGPCAIEGEEHCLRAAERLKEIFSGRRINFAFKSSYDKANRSSIHSYRGPGMEEGLRILARVKSELDIPVVTDVHSPKEAFAAAEVCDVIKTPAFLCRQTDLLVAAGQTGKPVMVVKGQFLAPWDMKNAIEKIQSTGNDKVFVVERGTTFGYNNLVADIRSVPITHQLGCPICFDAGHSVQLPGGLGEATGGNREYIPLLAKAFIAAGANAIYVESHPEPAKAKCDGPSVLDFNTMPALLDQLEAIYDIVHPSLATV